MPGAQATRCRTGREGSCWYTALEQALWVWAADHVPLMGERYGFRPSAHRAGLG